MSSEEAWTIGRLLQWTTDFLAQRGSESPRLDAEVLLAEVLGCQRIQLYTSYGDVAAEPVRKAFRELVRRRADGTPVAYLVGRREFYSLSFRVTPDVLIPRPETEFLVIRLLDLARGGKPAGASWQVADVGTGSGILAICAAKYLPNSFVTAVDRSLRALEVARANAVDHGVQERIEFVESDLLAALAAERRFDFIVSNPPYVTEAEFAELPRDVREHEPRSALVSGPRGTEIIERMAAEAADRLVPRGWLLVEISPQLEVPVRDLFAADARFDLGPTVKDLAGLARVVQARRNGEQAAASPNA